MGILTTLSDAFVGMCSTVVMVVTTVTEWVGFILHVNYTVVTSIYTTVCDILSVIFGVLDYVLQTAVVILVYIADFLYEIYGCVCALLVLVWRVLVLFYKIFCFLLTGVETLALGVWNGGVVTFKTLHKSAADVLESCESTTDYLAMLAQDFVAYVCNIFTTVGSFSADFVRGVWIGIGYMPAALAFLPVYVAQWINKLWMRCSMWTTYAFMGVTRETYLGVIIICILYLLVTRILCVMNARGMTLFSFRRRTSHARQAANRETFRVDRGFESDGNDDDDDDNNNNDDASDDEDSDDNGSETQTELTLSDNDDSDGHSVGSESDVSLNSQTFSSEESDHEIDVQLPLEAEHYSLRSRSSTPSRLGQKDMTHDQFEQELERERDKRKCVVCQDVNKSVLILPCKHMCLCIVCANQIVRSHFLERRVCPLCRSRIEKVINVYV